MIQKLVLRAGIGFVVWIAGVSEAQARSVDEIIRLYAEALGGQQSIARIHTRKVELDAHHGPKSTVYWQSPNKMLRLSGREKEGFDGSSGWQESKKKKFKKLSHAEQEELATDADPIRFVHLRDLYMNLEAAPEGVIDGKKMDVVSAPNSLGATKFFFDATNHLLCRIEEFGDTSAYYKHNTELSEYEKEDGILLPHRILRTSDEPGLEKRDIRVKDVEQNVDINPAMFSKPNAAAVTLGGKR